MSSSKRAKRSKRSEERMSDPSVWECTVCTYQNAVEAFKCEMCDTRKGTSTRKPKLNPTMVEQHTIVQNFVVQQEQQQILHSNNHPAHSNQVSASGRPSRKHSKSAKNDVNCSPSGSGTPTPSRSTRSVESPSDHSFSSSADHSPSTSKNPTPQPATPPPPLTTGHSDTAPVSPAAPAVPVAPLSASLPTTPVSSSSGKIRAPKRQKSATETPKQPGIRNVDKHSARSLAITVNGTTVVITDYKLKPPSQKALHTLKKCKSEPAGNAEAVPIFADSGGTTTATVNGNSMTSQSSVVDSETSQAPAIMIETAPVKNSESSTTIVNGNNSTDSSAVDARNSIGKNNMDNDDLSKAGNSNS